MRPTRLAWWLFTLGLAIATARPVFAQSHLNVLVVINETSPASVEVGEYYAKRRAIPQAQIVRIKAPATETIDRAEYERTIEAPIGSWLVKHDLEDQILYIVLTKGVPIRVFGTGGRSGTVASVDSELTLLYRKLTGVRTLSLGSVPNPVYLETKPLAQAKPFTRATFDIYLVTRLDGFTVADATALVDRSLAAVKTGAIVLDQRATLLDSGGDRWLRDAAGAVRQFAGDDKVLLESTRALAAPPGPVLGYYSWGSNDPANRVRKLGFDFSPGAIGAMFVSTDGRTFIEPPADWVPVDPPRQLPFYGNGSQSIAGDLIRDGLTGVAAHVDEPFLDGTIRPQILFPAYLTGFNLAESFYMAMPFLSWQTMVIGDPLCAPFKEQVLGQEALHKGIDPEIQMPALFAQRRLDVLAAGGKFATAGLKLALKAEGLFARERPDEGEKALVAATAAEPKLTTAQFQLAMIYEGRKEWDKAADRYQKVLDTESGNAIALNNLAYVYAVRLNRPQQALPIAEQAYKVSKAPPVADTLAWTLHLLGQNDRAATISEQAVGGAPTDVEILVHAAAIHVALGELARAKLELDAAVKADPAAASRDDVKALREKIKQP